MSTEIANYITSQYRKACEANDFDTRDRLYITAAPYVAQSELDQIEMSVAQTKGAQQRALAASYWRAIKVRQRLDTAVSTHR